MLGSDYNHNALGLLDGVGSAGSGDVLVVKLFGDLGLEDLFNGYIFFGRSGVGVFALGETVDKYLEPISELLNDDFGDNYKEVACVANVADILDEQAQDGAVDEILYAASSETVDDLLIVALEFILGHRNDNYCAVVLIGDGFNGDSDLYLYGLEHTAQWAENTDQLDFLEVSNDILELRAPDVRFNSLGGATDDDVFSERYV